jgi:hypothetical protein
MCSTATSRETSAGELPERTRERITEIGQAIDDLAAQARGMRGAAAQRPAEGSDTERVVARLAELWALIAELDPDIARRLPTYRID